MKKKAIIVVTIITLVVFLMGCSVANDIDSSISDRADEQNGACISLDQPVNTGGSIPDTKPSEVIEVDKNSTIKEIIEMFDQGEMDTLGFNMGDDKDRVIRKLGLPQTEDYLSGGKYMDYGNLYVFYDEYQNNLVNRVVIFEGELFSVELGKTTLDEVKNIFGSPDYESPARWPEDYGPEDNYEIKDSDIRVIYYGNSCSIGIYTEEGLVKTIDYSKNR